VIAKLPVIVSMNKINIIMIFPHSRGPEAGSRSVHHDVKTIKSVTPSHLKRLEQDVGLNVCSMGII